MNSIPPAKDFFFQNCSQKFLENFLTFLIQNSENEILVFHLAIVLNYFPDDLIAHYPQQINQIMLNVIQPKFQMTEEFCFIVSRIGKNFPKVSQNLLEKCYQNPLLFLKEALNLQDFEDQLKCSFYQCAIIFCATEEPSQIMECVIKRSNTNELLNFANEIWIFFEKFKQISHIQLTYLSLTLTYLFKVGDLSEELSKKSASHLLTLNSSFDSTIRSKSSWLILTMKL